MHTRMSTLRGVALALVLPGAFLAGCSSDDGGTNPGTTNVTPADASSAVGTLSFVNNQQITTAVDQVINGNLVTLPRTGGGAVWNATAMRWEYITDYSMSGYTQEYSWFAQYRNGGSVVSGGQTPGDDASGADQTIYETEQHISSTGEGKFPEGSSDYHSELDISQSTPRGGPVTYTLDGHGDVSATGTYQGQPANYNASWTYDLTRTVPGGCPSGTVIYTIGQFTVTSTYDGQGGYSWVMTEGGNPVGGEDGSGAGTISCGF